MTNLKYAFFLLMMLLMAACSTDVVSQKEIKEPVTKKSAPAKERLPERDTKPSVSKAVASPQVLKDCPIEGEILDGNRRLLRQAQQEICIVAKTSSRDKKGGESHRVLEVYDKTNCNIVFTTILPVNGSPDFAYRLADINYNNDSQLIAIKGYNILYCYNIKTQNLLPVLEPKFAHDTEAMDMQSGTIKHIELWENYLIGYAQDFGSFVFDLSSSREAVMVRPALEYGTNHYTSMFLLNSKNGEQQAILPIYNRTTQQFEINPIFSAPIALETNLAFYSIDKRYALLREEGTKKVTAVDLKIQKATALPDNLKESKDNGAILRHLKSL